MRIYADTSWWLAYKCRRDTHHTTAITLFDREPEAQVIWTPWQRVEIFNTFRQAERAGLIDSGESRQLIRLLEQEVRLGFWPHVEFQWTDAVRTDPYVGAGEALKKILEARATSDSKRHNPVQSYSLLPLVFLMARRGMRPELEGLWPELSRVRMTYFGLKNLGAIWNGTAMKVSNGTNSFHSHRVGKSWSNLR